MLRSDLGEYYRYAAPMLFYLVVMGDCDVQCLQEMYLIYL